MQYSKGMSMLGSLPNFSADDLVKSHLAVEVIRQFDLQMPAHFLREVQAPVSKTYIS